MCWPWKIWKWPCLTDDEATAAVEYIDCISSDSIALSTSKRQLSKLEVLQLGSLSFKINDKSV
jgi:hypothetical protein